MGLTVKHFTDAFKKTGVRPIQNSFCSIDGVWKKACFGCALTALYLSAHDLTEKELIKMYNAEIFSPESMEVLVEEWAHKRYGYGFTRDFIHGFDSSLEPSYDDSPGGRLGIKVRKAVFASKKKK